MDLTEILNVFALASALFFAILIFNLLLRRTVTSAIRDLFFNLGVFIMFSLLILLMPILTHLTNTGAYNFIFDATLECLWWFSLNMLANEALTYFIWDKLLPSKGVTVSKLLRDLVASILIIITIACIFHFVFHRSVVGLFTASGVMAVILGYSAQATLGEAFAGIGLNITRQFDRGDWISVNGNTGKVEDVTWRFVNLLTKDGNHLSIPNSVITKANIINFSRPDPLHGIAINVTVKAVYSPETVKKMLIKAATQCFNVSSIRPPFAAISELGSVNNTYCLTYFTTHSAAAINDQILSNFWYQTQKLEDSMSDGSCSLITHYSIEQIHEFLQQTDLFSSLTKEEINQLAQNCEQNFYGPPEQLLAQGQSNDCIFMIYKGGVDVYIQTPNQEMTRVASLGSGIYFGEMSLLTGEPAGASILVNTESTIIKINHESMATLFAKRPELVEKISAIIISRKLQNENVRESFNKNTDEKKSLVSQLANRIKNFFKK